MLHPARFNFQILRIIDLLVNIEYLPLFVDYEKGQGKEPGSRDDTMLIYGSFTASVICAALSEWSKLR